MATVSFEWKEILKLILQSDSKIEEILEVLISAISRISIDRPALDKVSYKRKTALEGMMRAQAKSKVVQPIVPILNVTLVPSENSGNGDFQILRGLDGLSIAPFEKGSFDLRRIIALEGGLHSPWQTV